MASRDEHFSLVPR
ncbi:hypothetical protein LINPERPRIM_LOCUS35794 [Linum perenne]